jgi:hypothetical protein
VCSWFVHVVRKIVPVFQVVPGEPPSVVYTDVRELIKINFRGSRN